jgi:hypothetical protein
MPLRNLKLGTAGGPAPAENLSSRKKHKSKKSKRMVNRYTEDSLSYNT